MSVIYNTAVKNDRMEATMNYFANGTLEILTAADALLATFGLDVAGGSVTGNVWTLIFDADTVVASGTGTAAKAQVKTSGGSAHLTGLTVGTAATDIILDSVSITSGQDVTLTTATITHAT